MIKNNLLKIYFLILLISVFASKVFAASNDLSVQQILDKYGSNKKIIDINVDSAGKIFITDGEFVFEFSPEGKSLNKKKLEIDGIVALLFDKDDNLCFVSADSRDNPFNKKYYFVQCDENLKVVRNIYLDSCESMQLEIDKKNNVYAFEKGFESPGIIKKFNPNGKLENTFGEDVTEFTVGLDQCVYFVKGSWQGPRDIMKISPEGQTSLVKTVEGVPFGLCDIAVDAEGIIYVCGSDYGVKRIDKSGAEFIFRDIGNKFSLEGYPQKIIVDKNKNMYVVGSMSSFAFVFDNEGTYKFKVSLEQ